MVWKAPKNQQPTELYPARRASQPAPAEEEATAKLPGPGDGWIAPPATDTDAEPPSQLPPFGTWAAIAAGGYMLLLCVIVVLASGRLYQWSRNRIVQHSPLASLESIEPTLNIPRAAPVDTRGENAVATAAEDATQSQESTGVVSAAPALNVLLLGTDARPEDTDPARTDTMMLLTLNPQAQTVGLLSLPRDLWVPIPGQGITTKINMAYVIGEEYNYPGGGAQMAMDTVSSFVGRPVEYYVRVNFHGFTAIVDLIGGIDLVVPTTIHDEEYPTADYGVETFHLDAGPQHLDGETALKYVRTRNGDDDYERARRQQQVIQAIAEKVMRADMIPTLLPKLPTLFYTMRSAIDTNIPMARQLELAQYVSNASDHNLRRLVLDDRYGEETYSEEGAWILFPNRERIRAELERFFDDAPPGSETDVASASIDPHWVRVEVLNGTGQPGVAARTRDLLQARGWQVVAIDDADRSDYDHTLIVNYGAPPSLVERMGAELATQSTPTSLSLDRLTSVGTAPVDVRIVVGRDLLPRLQ